jgi:CSLREA domain-containing protein
MRSPDGSRWRSLRARSWPRCSLLAAAPVLTEATFTVNSPRDRTDASPGDGVCETSPGNGTCTLRAAIMEANALVGSDTVMLPGGTFTLTISGGSSWRAVAGGSRIGD